MRDVGFILLICAAALAGACDNQAKPHTPDAKTLEADLHGGVGYGNPAIAAGAIEKYVNNRVRPLEARVLHLETTCIARPTSDADAPENNRPETVVGDE